ncbi:MAG: fimbrial assembly protein FimA [Ktedonobacter sp. 13_2_20CM_2_54_8]|nr:MAG: fimbrial assembly protein FimA [Ktedonobacter sp. 13_2_20CM_53_11]OLB63231.1 MAG: fimbrial assembly protein FimA [Ktedonobacter sp. 13_2_20CM_2_54_8]
MTFSIVARDPQAGESGIAVQSKFLAVGAVVPWAKAGVGAIATQSWANTSYGPRGLELLASGLSVQETLAQLIGEDDGRASRQVGIVGVDGQPATFTGDQCFPWAGGQVGEHYTCQGNILVGKDTVLAMARTFEQTTGRLCDRLVAALAAGQAAGGDSRGQQSAALLVVRQGGGYGGFNDRFIDLRVDDHPQPINELQRILQLHKLYLFPPDPADILVIDHDIARELQQLLTVLGDYQGAISGSYDEVTRAAFRKFSGRENLEERWFEDARVDRTVLEFLRQKANR